MRRTLSIVLVLALALAACTSNDGVDTTTTSTVDVTTTEAEPTSTTTDQGVGTTTTTSVSSTVASGSVVPVGIEDLPVAVQNEIIELVRTTERIRGLAFLDPPVITVVTDDELAERVRTSIEEEIDDIEADEALFDLLGLISPETELLALYSDLYGEQVGGFYDGEEGELVVPSDESLSPLQRMILVHELTHALTDQHFGMWDSYQQLVEEQRYDEAAAFLSVIEGDATLTEVLYLQQLDVEEQREVISESLETDSAALQATPLFIRESLVFPYTSGFEFAQRLFELGGFSEIGRAYSEPPVSTEQIIEPRDYRRDLPVPVPAPISELAGYELIYDSVWGQLSWDLMLEQVLGDTTANTAADGWGGDRYTFFFDGVEAALVIDYRGDLDRDVDELQAALVEYVTAAMAVETRETLGDSLTFSGDDFAAIVRSGEALTFIAASDPAVGRMLVGG